MGTQVGGKGEEGAHAGRHRTALAGNTACCFLPHPNAEQSCKCMHIGVFIYMTVYIHECLPMSGSLKCLRKANKRDKILVSIFFSFQSYKEKGFFCFLHVFRNYFEKITSLLYSRSHLKPVLCSLGIMCQASWHIFYSLSLSIKR